MSRAPQKPTRPVTELRAVQDELAALRERYAALNQLGEEFAAIKNELASLRNDFSTIRNRQVLPLDDGMLAIRHEIGWIVCPSEDFAFVVHFANGFSGHEHGTGEVIRSFVRPGDTVVDLGAHIGLHSIALARAVGPDGMVIAVEPLPRTAECLRRAMICNDLYSRCELVVGAAGDTNGCTHFYLGDNSMLGSLFPLVDDHSLVEVREFRLDDHVGPERRVDFVKIDVEGAELRALDGMRGLIARNDDIVVVAEYGAPHLERVGINPADWFAAFADTGLGVSYRIDETNGALLPVDLDYVADLSSYNVLFVKDAQRAAAHLAA
jgi:FkbM family methyltransferase